MKIEKAQDRPSMVITCDWILWAMKLALVSVLLLGAPSHVRSEEAPFPYRLNRSDLVLLPLGAGTMFIPSLIRSDDDLFLIVEEIDELDTGDVSAFDRGAVDNWNRTADACGDFFASALPYFPAVLLPHVVHAEWKNATTLGVMYLEVCMLIRGLTKLTKTLFPRNRPFAYNSDYTAAERYDIYGKNGWSYLIWGTFLCWLHLPLTPEFSPGNIS